MLSVGKRTKQFDTSYCAVEGIANQQLTLTNGAFSQLLIHSLVCILHQIFLLFFLPMALSDLEPLDHCMN